MFPQSKYLAMICVRCKIDKSIELMSKRSTGKPRKQCKKCVSELTQEYWRQNPHRKNRVIGKPRGTRAKGIPPQVMLDPEDHEKFKGYTWRLDKDGYAGRRIMREDLTTRTSLLHREIMDCPPGFEVDHMNGIPTDCRRKNLRIVTKSENQQNAITRSTSGFLGVYSKGDHYYATATRNGKTVYILSSKSLLEVRLAAINYRLRNYPGYKARHLMNESPLVEYTTPDKYDDLITFESR
jgi:hypothetical protein